MSLALRVKRLHLKDAIKVKAEKIVQVEFRGVCHSSRQVVDPSGGASTADILIDEVFEWPVARPVDPGEVVRLSLLVRRGYLGNKLIGSYSLVLQAVVETGRLMLSDALVDVNSKPIPITVEMDVHYIAPEGQPLNASLDDEQHLLVDVEQNIANLEHSLSHHDSRPRSYSSASDSEKPQKKGRKVGGFLRRSGSYSTPDTPDTSPVQHSKKARALNSVRSLIRLGRMKSKDASGGQSSGDEGTRLLSADTDGESSAPVSAIGSVTSLDTDIDTRESPTPDPDPAHKKLKATVVSVTNAMLKSADFQICVTIIEARQLAGLNMDPVVCVQVGEQRKYTSVKESTNCPYYNEYFVFDFHMPPVMLFDKIITLSVLHSRRLMRSGTVVGTFKIDVQTVYDAPDHQFYHKWALLTDPEDIAGGPKGYLKCDLSVMGKGDTIRVPPNTEKDDDDIEANLLLPAGVPVDRQRARFIVKIYRADGLPKMNSTLVANVKKAFTGESHDLVSPYVQVSFAGLSGKTSVKKHCYAPVWNEQLVFTEMFPPLCQRIKLQLRDNDPVSSAGAVIGTHFIDLKAISNDGDKGFLPTFGPSFVYLYGSTRDYRMIDEHAGLNEALGEGVAYRARLLIAIRTEITDNFDLLQNEVEREPTFQIQESSYGRSEELFLFGSILEAGMIEKKLGEKPILFELSMGNAGNVLDGHNITYQQCVDADGEDNLEAVSCGEGSSWQSTTPAAKPMSHDRVYYFLPYWDDKPCMHVLSVWPDHRRRMFNSNLISRIADKLEEGLAEVTAVHDMDETAGERQLRSVLDQLSTACGRYLNISKGSATGPGTGKTKLDKERVKLCHREIEQLGSHARTLRALVTKSTYKERYKTTTTYLQKLRFLEEDPQSSVPDVMIWAVSGGRRVAYHRLPARDIMYSIVDEERGRHCGKVQTIFLKLPGKKSVGPSGWAIQSKLQMYLWLGMLKHKKHFVDMLPQGYEASHEIRNADRPRAPPPSYIHYLDRHWFELRAHMYQARSLIGSDASGLSDPFARVVAGEISRSTQVIDETVSPTWDELLVFPDVQLWGMREEIQKEPPPVVIEVFDRDKVGKAEFIGRAVARPHVHLIGEHYSEPALEWFELTRGPDHAGELLACFELLQYQPGVKDLPLLPPAKDIPTDAVTVSIDTGPILPVPRGIRPTLAKYRIEVLFWGLRDLKRIHLLTVDRPRVDIECAGHILYSSVIQNARKNPNFQTPVKFLELELPEQELYRPPLTIRAVDCRSFGRFTLVGTHTISSVHKYMFVPVTKRDRNLQLQNGDNGKNQMVTPIKSPTPIALATTNSNVDQKTPSNTNENTPLLQRDSVFTFPLGSSTNSNKKEGKKGTISKKDKRESVDELEDDEESRDWWTKYFASMEAMIEEGRKELGGGQNGSLPLAVSEEPTSTKHGWEAADKKRLKTPTAAAKIAARLSPKSTRKKQDLNAALIKIYPGELETQPEYSGFKEWLLTFELTRGKKTGEDTEDETRVVGLFKGALKVYKWPLPRDVMDHTIMGFDPQYGFFQGLPSNEPMHVLVRVYVVKANDLHPMDLNGKADPYVVLQLGSKRISDKDHYISKQLNPVFGKCFEIEATFPQDSMLTVQILDWDLVGSDEMIGETKIDLENRFYSRHRATCGIPRKYEQTGFNQWRDPMKPTQILTRLCKEGKIEPPTYLPGSVRIGRQVFSVPCQDIDPTNVLKGMEEQQALSVLHRWQDVPRVGCQLVPEHIETRPIYHPSKPGIEQGKLEMWVDLFPMDMPLPGPPLDISPRKPKSYELRIIIWNTDDVVLEDDAFFTGEKMSDIYVKGWVKGPEDCQYTDIHYRSLTGEGNFNWRFIFPFEYLLAEEKIVITRKESLFSWDETECKIPARLELQVWDADHFSADDFLGAITLDLNRFPRGAKSSKLCTLDMLKSDGSVPMVNIFKQKRVKGWWPFYIKKDNDQLELTGKVEAEIHLLMKEEAERIPAGCGRNEPDPLEKPNRPDASFMWFLNPIKSIRYVIWHNYKWAIIKFLCIFALFIIILLFVYAIPGYTVKRIIGA